MSKEICILFAERANINTGTQNPSLALLHCFPANPRRNFSKVLKILQILKM